jgi:Secretion system C-terminal sorting domain
MKQLQLVLFLLTFCAVHSFAQQTLVVNPGPAGTLNQAIANNPNVTTFVLKRNFPYLLSGELNLTTNITIKAEDGTGKRPIILYGPPPGAPNIDQLIRTSANLRLEGLHITNRDNLGGISQRMVRTNADNIRIEAHDCIFDDSGQTAFRLDSKGTRIIVTDCIATRMGQPSNPDNGRFIDDRGNQVDSVIIDNSIVYNVTSRIYRDGGEVTNFMSITNSTFMNAMQRGFEIGRVREFTFLNNICADLQINGRDSSLVAADNETNVDAAWLRIDSTGTGGENWTIGYSNFFYTDAQLAYYAFPFLNDDSDTVTVADFFNPNALKAIQAGNWQNTILTETLDFKLGPDFPTSIIDTFNFGANANAKPWVMNDLTPDPVYSQLPAGTDRFAVLHDFNYDCSKLSNTGGVNGIRLGAQLTGDCFVSARDLFDEYGVIYYPNPANDRVFVQGLRQIERINLFNMNGQLVRTLKPLNEWTEISLGGLNSGIYFISLTDEAGNVSARKLVKQ